MKSNNVIDFSHIVHLANEIKNHPQLKKVESLNNNPSFLLCSNKMIMENIVINPSTSKIPHIDCIIENAILNQNIDKSCDYCLLGKPHLKDIPNQTGDVTITLFRNNDNLKTHYTIWYKVNYQWKKKIYKRYGMPREISNIIDELCWLISDNTHENDLTTNHINDFIKRLTFYRHHRKLSERYRAMFHLINFED